MEFEFYLQSKQTIEVYLLDCFLSNTYHRNLLLWSANRENL